MASTPNLRLVKCPKCKNTLKKPADLAVYQCGACNTILKSTRWMAGGNNSVASTDSASIKNASQHSSEMTKLNHKAKTSSEDTFNSEDGCCGTREDNLKRSAGSGKETGREEEKEEDIEAVVGDKMKKTETKMILDPRKNISNNEKSTNKAKDFLDYGDHPSHGASPSYHSPTTNMSSPAYEGSISSSSPDDNKGGGGGGDHTRNQRRLLVSRRTFRPSMQKTENKVGGGDIMSDEKLQLQGNVCSPAQTQTSSSKCNSSEVIQSPTPRKEDPPHQLRPSSEEFHSTFNSVDSEEAKSFGYYPKKDYWKNFRNQSPSSKFRDIENSRMELLRKVDALRYQLVVGSRDLVSNKARPPLYGIHKSNQQFTVSSMARPRSYPSSNHQQLVSSDQTGHQCCSLHCAIICGNNGLCTSCSHSLDALSNNPPLMQDYKAIKNVRRAKDKVVKRHCRPILGGANFISCDHCYCVLQIPEDVHFSTTTSTSTSTSTHKIQCGNCRYILTFSIRETNHNSPYTNESVDTYLDRRGTAGVPNSYCSEEYEAEPSSNGDEHEGPPSPLHRLMGYYSASEIIYQPPE